MDKYLVGYQDVFEEIKAHSEVIKIVAFAVCLILFVYWIAIHPFLLFKRSGIPYLSPIYPILGNLPQVLRCGPTQLSMKCVKELGGIYGFFVGKRPIVVVSDPKLLEILLVKEFSQFHNRPSFLGKKKSPMHLDMLFADYPDWRQIRLTVNPTFTVSKVKQVLPLVQESSETLVGILKKLANKSESVDVFKCFQHFTMEVILSVAFGLKSDFQLNENKSLLKEAADKWFRIDRKAFLVDILPIPLFVRQCIQNGLFSPDPAFFLRILKPVIEERKKRPSDRKDFLQLLLTENTSGGKAKLSDDAINATSISFLLAGYETTSNTLAYTTYLLALHPDIQQRLFEEIQDYLSSNSSTSLYDNVQNLEYLDQVLSESLRLLPPAYRTARLTTDDCKLGGYFIAKNTSVIVPIYAIHHCEKFWKDHDKFDPERFSKENKAKMNPFHYLPFGYGPRNCVGMRFALIEAKLTIVELLKAFKFVRTSDTEVPLEKTFGLTMTPSNGIQVGIELRE